MLLEHNVNVYNELEQTLANNNCCCVVMGTGVGKTYVATEYLKKHNFRALVVSPRQSINESWEKHTKRVEAITYQKLANIYKDIDYTKYNVLICDEVHHIGAPKWGKPIKYLIDNKIIKVIGLTESSVRYTDGGRDVAEEFFGGNVAFGESVSSAIEKQILNPVTYVGAMYNSDGLKKTLRGKIQSRLYAKLNLALNKTLTVQEIVKKNMPGGKRKGIIFASTIDDIKFAKEFMQSIYPNAIIKVVHSKQSEAINEKVMNWFAKAKEGYVCSVDMISEGVHIKGVNTLIMLRRTESVNLFNQQLGRCLDASSKEPAILFDLVNNKYSIRIIKNKLRIKVNSIFDSGKLNVIPSEQLIVKDYTKDIVEVLEEIRESLDNHWTDEEIEIVKKYYPIEGLKCYKRLNGTRTMDAVRGLADRLNLKCEYANVPYTEKEKNQIKNLWKEGKTPTQIAKILNRPVNSISFMVLNLGLRKKKEPRLEWSDEEIKILVENYPKMGRNVMSLLPNKSIWSISGQAQRLNLKKDNTTYQFTLEDDEYIKANWGDMTMKQIFHERFENKTNYGRLHHYVYHIRKWNPSKKFIPIRCVETNKIYYSFDEICKDLGKNKNCINTIRLCCQKKPTFKTAHGYHWEYVL